MRKNDWYKKGLVFVIIVLFIGVGVFTSVSSKNISASDEKMLEYDIKSNDNNEIGPLDNYVEIISRIDGLVEDYEWYSGIIIQHLHCYGGKQEGLNIQALTINPLKIINVEGVKNLEVRRFIGFIIAFNDDAYQITGYAIGNIDW